jgi:hypothetical protein
MSSTVRRVGGQHASADSAISMWGWATQPPGGWPLAPLLDEARGSYQSHAPSWCRIWPAATGRDPGGACRSWWDLHFGDHGRWLSAVTLISSTTPQAS